MTQLRTILLLTFGFFSTILFEILRNSYIQSSDKITLLEHIQSLFTLTRLIDVILLGSIVFILLMGLLIIVNNHGIFVIYIILLKFFELMPLLIDLINLLFIYQYKINDSSHRLHLSLFLATIRLIISLDIVRRKCDCRWKRQIVIIFDLLLFILVNISLIRYTNKNLFRIGRKIILGLLIFQLNNLFYNEDFWISFIKSRFRLQHDDSTNSNLLNIVHLILSIRWIISSFIILLFIFFTFQSILINEHESLFSIKTFYMFIKAYSLLLLVCITILYVIHWDTLHNRNALNRYGISQFCIGLDLLSSTKSTEISSAEITTTVTEILMGNSQQTCSVCYDDKNLNEFDLPIINNCQHVNRSVCNFCLFNHVQKTFQITFTDDIHCPELNCGVKFDYDTVKMILFLNGNDKLVERYDRYVFHRQLEQMDEFIWCSNPSCNVGQLNEDGELNNIVTCFNCHQKTCFTHKVQWHEGITCEEYDLGIDPDYESSRRWIVENSKKCPNCPYQIEKNDGCDHMICIKCRHEFCWSCLADFQPIRRDGNHRHKDTCKHYAAYDGE